MKIAAVQSIIATLILGVGMGIVTLSVCPLLPKWLGAAPEIQRNASTYFSIICLPMLFRVVTCLGQVVFSSLVTGLGTLAFAAHSIALTAEQAFYIPGYGMQAAASTLAGNALGEKDEKKLHHTSVTIMGIAVTNKDSVHLPMHIRIWPRP